MRQFFNTCIAIEKTIGTIYRHLAESVSCDSELRSIWQKMAKEEDQHALDLGFAARLPGDGNFQPKADIMAKLVRMHDFAKQALERAQSGLLSPRSAVELSLQLENEFLAIHIASAVEFKNESIGRMFAAIVRGDEEHCRAIRDYHARTYGE